MPTQINIPVSADDSEAETIAGTAASFVYDTLVSSTVGHYDNAASAVNSSDMWGQESSTAEGSSVLYPATSATETVGLPWHVVINYVLGVFGMLDNGFVILIILLSKNMRKKVCNMLIINQSVIDFVASFYFVTNSPSVIRLKIPQYISPDFYCWFWANSFLLWSSFIMSTGNLILISLERFLEVVYPLVYKVYATHTKGLIAICLVWVVGAVIEFGLTGYSSVPAGSYCALYVNFPSEVVRNVSSVIRYILAIILPLTIMTFCYAKMIHTMREIQPALASLSVAERNRQVRQDRVRRNLIKAMLTVSVAYFMCVGWNQTYFFLINMNIPLPFGTPFYHFTVYAQFINCLVNPIIYTAKYREFQISVRNVFKSCFPYLFASSKVSDINSQSKTIRKSGGRQHDA